MKSNGKHLAETLGKLFTKKRFTRSRLTALMLTLVMVTTVIGSLAIFSDRVTTQMTFRTFVLTLDDYTLETGYLPGPYIAGETVPVTITESNPGADLESVITLSITWSSPDDECKIFGHANAADNAVIKVGDTLITVTPEMLSNDNNTVTFDLPAHALPSGSMDVTRNLTLEIPDSLMGTGDISYTYQQVTLTPTGEGEPKVIEAEDLTGHNFTVRVGWAASDQPYNNGKNLMGFLVAREGEEGYDIQFEFPYDTCDESAMCDFAARDAARWSHYKDEVVELHFIEGMTSIGNYAFPDFSKVESVEFPTTVRDIGISAFDNAGLTGELVIPATVKNIESLAFGNLEDVDEITFLHTTNDLSLPKNREEGKEETGAFYVSEHVETTVNSTVPGILYEYGWHDGWDNRRGIPMLNDGDSWHRTWVDYDYTTPVDESALTSIQILDYYMPDGTEEATWDASAYETVEGKEFNGKVTAYLKDDGKTLILAGNGYGLIHANPISTEAFCYLENVTEISDANLLDTRYTTDMSGMFYYCESLESLDVHTWDVSKVTSMSYMFEECGSLVEMDLSRNTAEPKSGKSYYATGEYEAWNPVSLEDCSFMFSMYNIYDYENPDDPYARLTSVNVTGWETNSLTHPERMFINCANMTEVPGISDWDMSQVETTEYMFYYCLSLNDLDVSKWDMGSNTSTYHMFYYCQSLPGVDISGWNMSSVTDTENMFYHCESFTELTIPASLSVINEGFANYCPKMTEITFLHKEGDTLTFPDGNYSAFYVKNNLDDENPITYTENDPLRTKVYYEHEEVLNYNWRTDRRGWVVTVVTVEGGSVTAAPTTAINGKTIALTATPEDGNSYYGATVSYTDTNGEPQSFEITSDEFTMPMADVTVTPEFGRPVPMLNDQFYWRSTFDEETGEWNDSPIVIEDLVSIEIVDEYVPAANAEFAAVWDASDDTVPGTVTAYLSEDGAHLTIAGNGSGFIYANPDSTGAFMGFYCPTITGTELLDTSKMVIADVMFGACSFVESLNVSNWDVSKMESAKNMFLGCYTMTELDVSKWNTSSLKYAGIFDLGDMATYGLVNETGMFGGCWALPTLDVATKTVNAGTPEEYVAWDTSNLIDAHGMFAGCRSATELDVSKWNTSNLRNAQAMFWDVSLSSIPVDNWNTSSLEETADMFRRCPNLTTVNVSKWDVSSLITTARMFYECPKLETMDFSTWDESVVQQTAEMFYGCTGLESVTLTGWNLSNIAMSESAGQPDARTHAMFEGCTSLQSLTIPASLTKFGENFAGSCTSLTEITFLHDANTELWLYAAGPNGAFYAGDSFSAENPLITKVTTTNKDVLAYEWDKDLRGYKVAITEVTGATVTAEPAVAVAGQTVTLTVTPDANFGYNGATVTYKDGNGATQTISLNAGTTTFTMPAGNATVKTNLSYSGAALDRIAVTSEPAYSYVDEGSNFDKSTATVTAYFTDGSETVVKDYDVENGENMQRSQTAVTLSYTLGDVTKTADHDVRVAVPTAIDSSNRSYAGYTGAADEELEIEEYFYNESKGYWCKATSIAARAFQNNTTLKSVKFPDSIGFISNQAFNNCTNLQSVEFGTGLRQIQTGAFSSCRKLTGNLVLPDSLRIIDEGAFSSTMITSLDLGDGVQTIGVRAFSWCSSLTGELVIPDSTTIIGTEAFNYTKITSLDLGAGVQAIGSNAFQSCTSLAGELVIPDSTTTIGASSFTSCSQLTSLVLGKNVKTIGNSAFSGCSGLTCDLVIPSGVTSIGTYAFSSCSKLSGDLTIPDSVTSLGSRAFYACRALESVTVGSGVTTINESTFSSCTGLTSADLSNGVKTIGNYAFYDCSSLQNVNLGDCLTTTGTSAFAHCTSLTSIGAIGSGASIEIPSSLTSLSNSTFIGCTGLTSVKLPDTVISIGNEVFKNCTSLQSVGAAGSGASVEIPGSITSISPSAFYGCTGLKTVVLPDTVIALGDSAFYGCTGLVSAEIPGSVATIGASAFYGCSSLTSAELGSGVSALGSSAFSCSGLQSIGPVDSGASIELPATVTALGSNAFQNCTGLKTVVLPNTVTTLGTYAFYGCTGLTSAELGNGVTSIGASTFYGCSSLSSVALGNAVTTLGSNAFQNCKSLQSIGLVGSGASVELPATLTTIGGSGYGSGVFMGCTGLKTVVLPNSVETLGHSSFSGCTSLTNVVLPDKLLAISDQTFNGCKSLQSVGPVGSGASIEIPSSVTTLGEYAFAGCSGLTSVKLPAAVSSIGNYAFGYCTGLQSVGPVGSGASMEIPSSVTTIGAGAFQYCRMKTVQLPSGITSIGNQAFWYNSSLQSVIIPDGVTTIGPQMFQSCSALTRVEIPVTVTAIKDSAFVACSALKDVYYAGDETQWNAITIAGSNTPLTNATKHYNSTMPQ